MAAKRCIVRITENFESNLDAIDHFLTGIGASALFNTLLDDLTEHIVPALEHHPDIGRPFLTREAHSVEARQRIDQIIARMGGGAMPLREYIAVEFLILYAQQDKSVYLLSIKHHRQLSFDFPAHWH